MLLSEQQGNTEPNASVEVKGLKNDVITLWLCFLLQMNCKGATFDLHQQHTGTKCQRIPVLDKKQEVLNSACLCSGFSIYCISTVLNRHSKQSH